MEPSFVSEFQNETVRFFISQPIPVYNPFYLSKAKRVKINRTVVSNHCKLCLLTMVFKKTSIHAKLENRFFSGDCSRFFKNKWAASDPGKTLREDLDGCFIVIELQQHVLFVRILNKKV